MRRITKSNNRIALLSALIALALGACILLAGCASNSTQSNRALLEDMESQSVDEAQQLIYKRADEKRVPLIEQYGADGYLEPEISRQVMQNCVVVGDSVTYMGFLAGFITSDECSAYYSVSLKTCDDYVQAAIDMHPECIIFNYGTNDMVLFGGNAQDFADKYLERCQYIKSQLPYVKIYIASTMAPSAEAQADNPGMVYADDFNAAVKAMCETTDRVSYLDTAFLVDEHTDLRGSDGIHFQDEFYGYWYCTIAKEMFL